MYEQQVRVEALRLLDQGLTPREISKRMGGKPGPAIIRRWAKGETPVGKRRHSKLYTVEEKLAAIERLANGESYQDIASGLGCAPTTVLTWRRIYTDNGSEGLITRIDER